MVISTIKITDKNFRITIPEVVREVENLKINDIIQIDIKKIEKKTDKIPFNIEKC